MPWIFRIQTSRYLQNSGPYLYWASRYDMLISANSDEISSMTFVDKGSGGGGAGQSWQKLPVNKNEIYQLNFSTKRDTGNYNLKVLDFNQQNAKYYGKTETPIQSVLTAKDFGTTLLKPLSRADLNYRDFRTDTYSNSAYHPRTGITRDILYYENFMLKRYWTPVAKGMIYYENGEEKQFSANGFYDVINQVFKTRYWLEVFAAGDVNKQHPYNYFEDKEFGSTDVNYIVKMSSKQNAYTYPDALSSPSNRTGTFLYDWNPTRDAAQDASLRQGLIVPVIKVTSDAAHKIKGEWYGTCDEWFESKNATLDATLDSTKLTAISKTILPLTTSTTGEITSYLSPLAESAITDCTYRTWVPNRNNTDRIYCPIKIYFSYTLDDGSEMYFDGHAWIKKADTSAAVTDSNKNYTVAVTSMNYYSHPAAHNSLKLGNYYRGDRVTILYTSDVLPNWGYTGQGWVEISPNLSEIS